jgi:hypothetical protein
VREEERNDSRGACEGDGEEDGEELKADETSLEMHKKIWKGGGNTGEPAYVAISGQAYRLGGVNQYCPVLGFKRNLWSGLDFKNF